MSCPVSVALGEGIPEAEKPYATKGTELHEQSARYLKWSTSATLERSLSWDEETDPLVKVYVASIVNQFAYQKGRTSGSAKIYIEQRLPFLGSSGGIDCYILSGDRAYLYDLKTGEGVKVNAKDNEQLAFYACAIAENHPEVKRVTAIVVQPSIEDESGLPHIEEWEMSTDELRDWGVVFGDRLSEVDLGLEGSPPLIGSYCQFCKAKPVCPAHMEVLEEANKGLPLKEEVVEFLSGEHSPQIIRSYAAVPVQVDRIVHILKHKKHINSWLEKAEEYLFLRMKQGGEQADELVNIGVTLGRKRSYRRWKEGLTDAQIIEALAARGVVSPSKTKPLSITEIEKLGVDLSDLVEKPEGEECIRLE